MKISKEFKLGLLVVVGGFILYFGINYLKSKQVFSSDTYIKAKYKNVLGLQVRNPVMLNGYPIGDVSSIEYMHDNEDTLLVTLKINENIELSRAYDAQLSRGLLEGTSIVMTANPNRSKNGISKQDIYEDGDFIPGTADPSLISQIMEQVDPVTQRVTNILDSINNEIGISFDSINALISEVKRSGVKIEISLKDDVGLYSTLNKLKSVLDSAKPVLARVGPFIDSYKDLADSLKTAGLKPTLAKATEAMDTLKALLASVNNEEGSLGALMNSKDLVNNLNQTLEDFDFLAVDMQANPHRYVQIKIFGKSPDDSRILKKVKPKKATAGAVVNIDLKMNTPDDLKAEFYDFGSKTKTGLVITSRGNAEISVTIPSTASKGDQAINLSWNNGKDSESVSVRIK